MPWNSQSPEAWQGSCQDSVELPTWLAEPLGPSETVQDLKKVTPGYPVFLGKQGQLCHQTRGAPVLGDGATARRDRLCWQGGHVSRGPQGRRPAWTVGGSLNLVPHGLCPGLLHHAAWLASLARG